VAAERRFIISKTERGAVRKFFERGLSSEDGGKPFFCNDKISELGLCPYNPTGFGTVSRNSLIKQIVMLNDVHDKNKY